ncbi:MAG: hypothetical protein Q8N79_10200, partial [Candidatus Methanoperedens sp.]|nr:hypothetical protein [Candidatus Methanoperedens sp.]
MQLLTLFTLGLIAGSLIKLADDITDKNLPLNRAFAVPFGLAYGLVMGYLMINDADAAILFGGIVIGCLVTGKINSTGHYFGLAALLIVLFLYGIKIPPLVLPVAALAALDELKDALPLPGIIFEYRLFLKLGILALV